MTLLRSRPSRTLVLTTLALVPAALRAQGSPSTPDSTPPRAVPADSASRGPARDTTRAPEPRAKPWYEKLSLRGYTQVRYGRVVDTDVDGDRRNESVSIRRARVVLSGDVHPRVSIYIQPDFAAELDGKLNVAQLRDAYFDLYLDKAKTFRLRPGQSKIPYGFENMQSSSNRLPFERTDALNSAVPGERDLGLMFYWEPTVARHRFKTLTDTGLKGSGDYGVFALGVYNGQGINRADQNDQEHVVARLAYPFELPGGQFIEVGVQGYGGAFTVPTSQRTAGVEGESSFDEARGAASLVIYPQPIGFQAEWNVGRGPEYDAATNSIRTQHLTGGYAMVMYRGHAQKHTLTPFARWQYYDGGRKIDVDARSVLVREVESGVEWQPFSAFELTLVYVNSNRHQSDGKAQDVEAHRHYARVQAQFNY